MYITIYSACEKKAWKRSRRILDSYANRISERAWLTPITNEGLKELHKLLKASASRQTAISCYRNEGVATMRLLWTVGRKDLFSPEGFYPVAYKRNPRKEVPPSLRVISLLTRSAGYLHDWGKTSEDFASRLDHAIQQKGEMESERPRESVRHDWLSYCLLRGALQHGFDEAHKGASDAKQIKDCKDIKKGFSDRLGALKYIILTHHKLLGPHDEIVVNGEDHMWVEQIPREGIALRGKIDPALYRDAMASLQRIDDVEGKDYWRYPATIARASMIMADHYISSINYKMHHGDAEAGVLFANTKKDIDILEWNNPDANGPSRFDQPLNWHLRSVGEKAEDIAYHMLTESYPGLSKMTIDAIMEPSSISRFRWQDEGVNFIQKNRPLDSDARARPCLIFSGAGTGAGKTRANAKFACSLSDQPRFSIALNLRSLTLQTGDSMKADLSIQDHEMAVVIGDRVSEKLHRGSSDAFATRDKNGRELEIDVIGEEPDIPAWLSPLTRSGKQVSLVMPPVLVSTVDFIINAGEPNRQGHHALALLRVMNSDLILDELDSYDPIAMIAVLRLIQTTAMMGRSLICSSATMSAPIAEAVYKAFKSGLKMRELEQEYKPPQVYLIDDEQAPELFVESEDSPCFRTIMSERHERLVAILGKKPVYRKGIILTPKGRDSDEQEKREAYFDAISDCVMAFHDEHQWVLDEDKGRSLSFGLVRVANIRTAVSLAYHLSKTLKDKGAMIACYHSNEMKIQRHLKEKKLDKLLTRKSKDFSHIRTDDQIEKGFSRGFSSVPFVVIATPVEEIGRDHDFDWAIIEPSSAQSIVQTAGRVNRHRLVEMETPNVAVLDYNVRSMKGGEQRNGKRNPCFSMPGFESKNHLYSSDQVSEMLSSDDSDDSLNSIDASFRLGKRKMAIDEDRIIENRMSEGMSILLEESKGNQGLWMSNGFYYHYPLRGFTSKDTYRFLYDKDSGHFSWQMLTNQKKREEVWTEVPYRSLPALDCSWLNWSEEKLMEACSEIGLEQEEGMVLEIARYSDSITEIVHHKSFGFLSSN